MFQHFFKKNLVSQFKAQSRSNVKEVRRKTSLQGNYVNVVNYIAQRTLHPTYEY